MWPLLIAAALALISLITALALTRNPSANGEQLLSRLNIAVNPAPAPAAGLPADIGKEESLSRIPWMNTWLAGMDVAAELRTLLTQADLNWSVGGWLMISVFGWIGTVCLLYLRFQSLAPAGLFSLLYLPLPSLYVLRRRRRRFARMEEQLPEALDLLVSALRAGHSLMTAIGFLGDEGREPLKSEFLSCFEEQNYGVDLRTALLNLAARVPVQDVRIFVAAVLIQKESGGNLAEVLDNLSQMIRERFGLRREIHARTAQGRATGWILSLLPVVLGLAMYLVHPEGIALLWTHPVGIKLLYAAGGTNLLGCLIIRNIVRIRV